MSLLGKRLGWLRSKATYEWFPFKAYRKKIFYGSFIKKADLCLDVGAHLGDRSQTFLDLGAVVVAVEPQPEFVAYLKNKFRNRKNFHLEARAISDELGEATFYISSNHPTLSTLSGAAWQKEMDDATSQAIKFDLEIVVATTTLDQLATAHGKANFIKIDVEGFELAVLNGLNYQPDFLSIEFLSFDLGLLENCLDRLEELGYSEFNWSFRETFKWGLQSWSNRKTVFNCITNYRSGVFSGDVYARKLQ